MDARLSELRRRVAATPADVEARAQLARALARSGNRLGAFQAASEALDLASDAPVRDLVVAGWSSLDSCAVAWSLLPVGEPRELTAISRAVREIEPSSPLDMGGGIVVVQCARTGRVLELDLLSDTCRDLDRLPHEEVAQGSMRDCPTEVARAVGMPDDIAVSIETAPIPGPGETAADRITLTSRTSGRRLAETASNWVWPYRGLKAERAILTPTAVIGFQDHDNIWEMQRLVAFLRPDLKKRWNFHLNDISEVNRFASNAVLFVRASATSLTIQFWPWAPPESVPEHNDAGTDRPILVLDLPFAAAPLEAVEGFHLQGNPLLIGGKVFVLSSAGAYALDGCPRTTLPTLDRPEWGAGSEGAPACWAAGAPLGNAAIQDATGEVCEDSKVEVLPLLLAGGRMTYSVSAGESTLYRLLLASHVPALARTLLSLPPSERQAHVARLEPHVVHALATYAAAEVADDEACARALADEAPDAASGAWGRAMRGGSLAALCWGASGDPPRRPPGAREEARDRSRLPVRPDL